MAHAADSLVVDSVTGVDVSLEVAGTGARSLAFLIDLLIRTILVTAWFVVATLVYNGKFTLQTPDDPDGTWYLYVATPATLIYLLYHTVLEIVMLGRTPGKRMAGIRIVSRNGSPPAIAAQLVRNVFRLIDSFPVGYGVGLFTCLVTRDHVRVGDLAAGTLMIYENRNTLGTRGLPLSVRERPLDIGTLELVGELLDRWSALEAGARVRLAHSLIERITGSAPESFASEEAMRGRLEQLTKSGGPGAPS
ncbi:MAG: RDD family protein [Gammaproteobacteria bacterium]